MAYAIALAATAVASYLVWWLVRDYFVPSPFDNIPGPPSGSIWTGNLLQMFNTDSWDYLRYLCETYGPVARIHSFFGAKWLHVYDTKALHSIFVKDQDSYFRGIQAINGSKLLIGPGVFATYGDPHKKQRKMLNPVFSVGHMRNLTPIFYNISDRLQLAIETRVKDGPKELDILGWMGRTALELVGQGTLGYSFDPLTADSRDEYAEAVKAFIPSVVSTTGYRFIFPYLPYLGPAWFRRMLLHMVPNKKVQQIKYVTDTVHAKSQEIFFAKKSAIERGDQELLHAVGEGKDIMSILLKANLMADQEDKLPDDELLAQMSSFMIAGVDTTSNALSRILHLLSENLDVQAKLRGEVQQAQEQFGGQIPFDELMALPYLDAVCRETLRLHAPLTLSNRQARKDTILPLSEPIRGLDGKVMTELAIPKGTTFFLNLRACNTNKALWGDDALEWKPERWLKPLPRAVEEARIPGIYANLMTFISGGHSCIGFKFSQLEMKVVLSTLISAFKFERSDTPIIWNFAGIAFPTSTKGSLRPEMYLKVSSVSQ
ncbi:cytochrome P450 [Lentinus tigrinus ALCF2SS1-7]|uniref:Cytochrome P450 n=1 Tax=Lentinus tigrinus ALCF2SS1-6 TaxID=1328759 RepID=A0A5C2RVR8_9APHY|nr:cytochrome P450 [Lentinus tigrinus ALCF2SS1-6]RPD71292.1 cytochrome P450 [Lentinus tigrinus ALCF2SS1-7]